MSRRLLIAISVTALVAGLAGTVAAGQPACPAESTTDLWDVSQGAAITTSSGMTNGTGDNLFGQSPGPFLGEPGVAFFDDGQTDGFVHFVEWTTADSVLVTDFHLLAAHDGNDSFQRAFSTVSLYGWNAGTSTFDLWYSLNPSLPYGDGTYGVTTNNNLLDRCGPVPALVTDRFRAEFTQEGGGPFGAPRMIELDAFGSVVLPTPVPTPAASLADAAMVSASPANPAVMFAAVLVLFGALGAVLVASRVRIR